MEELLGMFESGSMTVAEIVETITRAASCGNNIAVSVRMDNKQDFLGFMSKDTAIRLAVSMDVDCIWVNFNSITIDAIKFIK